MDNHWKTKVNSAGALITGASGGIGKAIAVRLAKKGFSLIAVYNKNIEEVKSLEAHIRKTCGTKDIKIIIHKADMSDMDEIKKLFRKIKSEKFPAVSVLIYCAGILSRVPVTLVSEKQWLETFAVNTHGAFFCVKEVVRDMMQQGKGRIIFISSDAALAGEPFLSHYAASKAALHGFAKSIARELASKNITVNVVAPGFIDTPMSRNVLEQIKEKQISLIPMKRYGTSEEVASLVEFLVSEKASYITGQIISVDGGLKM